MLPVFCRTRARSPHTGNSDCYSMGSQSATPKRTDWLMKTVLLSCVGTDANVSNPELLRHFLAHYTSMGIRDWSITLHLGNDERVRNISVFQRILDESAVPFDVWQGDL